MTRAFREQPQSLSRPHRPADTAAALQALSSAEAAKSLLRMSIADAVGALDRPEFANAAKVLALLPSAQAGELVAGMADDRAADVLAAMGAKGRAVLGRLPCDVRHCLAGLMSWPADSAAGLMTTDYIAMPMHLTAAQALERIRAFAGMSDSVYSILLTDDVGKLVATLSLRQLINLAPDAPVIEIALRSPVSVAALADQERVIALIRRQDLLGLPVIDEAERPIGLVTVDDVIDALVAENTEDAEKFAGLEALGRPYLDMGFFAMFRKRAGWLSILLLAEMLTASVMQYFEVELEKAMVLALFIPLIMSSGGNSGSQATSLIIRALALGQVRLRDWWRVALREAPTGAALGGLLGLIGFGRIALWQHLGLYDYGQHWHLVGATITAGLIGVVAFGSLSGAMLPFLLQKAGLDPATASAPFVATLVDVAGLVIYFTVALVILSGSLL